MKTLIALTIVGMVAWAAGCSEKVNASLEVAKDRLEEEIVNSVGKGQVALKLQQRHIAHLKERLIEAKTLRKVYQQKAARLAASSTVQAVEQGNFEGATESDSSYETFIQRLEEMEKTGERSLKLALDNHQQLREKITFLEERKSMLDALGNLSDNANEGTSNRGATAEVRILIEELERDLLRAEAQLEVAQLNSPGV
jgi:hypothetical protein